jgi:hypothetical protein
MKIEKYFDNRKLYTPKAEAILELTAGKDDRTKENLFRKNLQPNIIQKIIYEGMI